MRDLVPGAGLIGVTSAYHLRQLGHEVTLVDRQATPPSCRGSGQSIARIVSGLAA